MFELMQRNAGPIRSLFGDPILGAGVQELLEDLTRGDRARATCRRHDADYMAGAMAGVALELGVRMAERTPADVEGAARFATELFLGGIARLSRTASRQRPRAAGGSLSCSARSRSSSTRSRPLCDGSAIAGPPSSGSAARSLPSISATSAGPPGAGRRSRAAASRSQRSAVGSRCVASVTGSPARNPRRPRRDRCVITC